MPAHLHVLPWILYLQVANTKSTKITLSVPFSVTTLRNGTLSTIIYWYSKASDVGIRQNSASKTVPCNKASVVAQWVKPLFEMPAFHVGMLI